MEELVGVLESASVVPHGAEEDGMPRVMKGAGLRSHRSPGKNCYLHRLLRHIPLLEASADVRKVDRPG